MLISLVAAISSSTSCESDWDGSAIDGMNDDDNDISDDFEVEIERSWSRCPIQGPSKSFQKREIDSVQLIAGWECQIPKSSKIIPIYPKFSFFLNVSKMNHPKL